MKKKKNKSNSNAVIDIRIAGSYNRIMESITNTVGTYVLSSDEFERVVGYVFGSLAILIAKQEGKDITATLGRMLSHSHNMLIAYEELKDKKDGN